MANTPYYTKAEADASEANLRRQYNYGASEYQGFLTKAQTPTLDGWYWATEIGTYTNAGGLVTVANKINMIEKDGSTFRLYAIDAPESVGGITDWTAKPFLSGDETISLGKLWRANSITLSTDVPGTSSKWVEVLTSVNSEITFSTLTPKEVKIYGDWKTGDVLYFKIRNSAVITTGAFNFQCKDWTNSINYAVKTTDGTYKITLTANTKVLALILDITGTVSSAYCVMALYDSVIASNTKNIETINVFLENQKSNLDWQKTEYQSNFKGTIGKNLYNIKTNSLETYIDETNGLLIPFINRQTSDFIKINPSTVYQIARYSYITYYNSNLSFISGFLTTNPTTAFTTPSTAAYLRIASGNFDMITNQQLELGSVKTAYEPYIVSIPNTIPVVITKTVSRNGTADFVGRRAIQNAIDSITDASASKLYIIKVLEGVYEATTSAHFDKNSPNLCFIQGKNFVSIIGVDKDRCIITAKLPNNLGSSFPYSSYQTLYWEVNNATLENLTIIGENLRYPIHIDGGSTGCKDFTQFIKNCYIKHLGNTGDAVNWPNWNPIGLGMSSGQTLTVEDSILEAPNHSGYMHTNADYEEKSTLILKRCQLIGYQKTGQAIIRIQALGSGVSDKFILEDCVMGDGGIQYDSNPFASIVPSKQLADHAEIELIATNILPRAIDNMWLGGKSLRIVSKSSGNTSTVRFLESSTAFNLICGNSLSTYEFENKYFRKEIFGYQYSDGGNALSGFALGGLNVSEEGVGGGKYKHINSLGKRLGDCSTVNKTLTVIIDGTSYNIVFNKNYNGTADTVVANYTNAQIIAEIVAVIGAFATVDEYCIGKDYYPTFAETTVAINSDTVEILEGMGIIFTSHAKIRRALNSDNRIDGICLDNCIVGGKARVIRKGEIFSRNSGQRFKTNEATSSSSSAGVEFGISTTLSGVFDRTASPKLLIATATNILKIK